MSVKATYELCKSLELNNEQIKDLEKSHSPKPAINQTPAERQNEMSENSKIRFMDYYADIVFSIMNVIEKHPERISKEQNKIAGNEYAVIKTTKDDFTNYLFEDMNIFKHEFIKKLNVIADNAPSIWITEQTSDGEQIAKSIYPILVFRDLKTKKQFNNLNNNKGVIAELQIAFNKELFIGKNTNGLTKAFRQFPEQLPTTIKSYLKRYLLCCLNGNGDLLKIEEKQLFKFIVFLRNHYNGNDFLKYPVDLFKIVNPRLINDKGLLRSTESFYLYLLLYIYAYNDLFISDKLDGFNFILQIPYWEDHKIRIPTEKLEELETTKITTEKNGTTEKRTIIQEKKGYTKDQLKEMAKQANKEIDFTLEHYTNSYALTTVSGYTDESGVKHPTYKKAKITFYEYLQDIENIPLKDIYNNLQNEEWGNKKRKNYIKYLETKDLFRTSSPIENEKVMGKLMLDNFYIVSGINILEKLDKSNDIREDL